MGIVANYADYEKAYRQAAGALMQPYRFREAVSPARFAGALVVTGSATTFLAYCYATVLRDCPFHSGYLWIAAMLMYGGIQGKCLEKTMLRCHLRGERVARSLAIPNVGLGIGIVYALLLQGAEAASAFFQVVALAMIVWLCLYSFRWRRYGYCDRCDCWLEPDQILGPYRYNKGMLTQLEMQECLDLSFLEKAPHKCRKICTLVLSCCPDCREFKTLRVDTQHTHVLGVDRGIAGLFRIPVGQPPGDIGPSLPSGTS